MDVESYIKFNSLKWESIEEDKLAEILKKKTILEEINPNIRVFQDSDHLPYGTMTRSYYFFRFLFKSGARSVFTSCKNIEMHHLAFAFNCRILGIDFSIYTDANEDGKMGIFVEEAKRLGAIVKNPFTGEVPTSKDLEEYGRGMHEKYKSDQKEKFENGETDFLHKSYFIPEDLDDEGLATMMKKAVHPLFSNYDFNFSDIWISGNFPFFVKLFGTIFPSKKMNVVKTRKWEDEQISSNPKVVIYNYPANLGDYESPAVYNPPYFSLPQNDAKLWYFKDRIKQKKSLIINMS